MRYQLQSITKEQLAELLKIPKEKTPQAYPLFWSPEVAYGDEENPDFFWPPFIGDGFVETSGTEAYFYPQCRDDE